MLTEDVVRVYSPGAPSSVLKRLLEAYERPVPVRVDPQLAKLREAGIPLVGDRSVDESGVVPCPSAVCRDGRLSDNSVCQVCSGRGSVPVGEESSRPRVWSVQDQSGRDVVVQR